MFNVVCIGGVSRDVFLKTSEGKLVQKDKETFLGFLYGSKIIPEEAYFTYGGGGYNTSVNFSRLGLRVALVSSIAKEGTGSSIVSELKKRNVNISHLYRNSSLHTALSIIIVEEKDHVIFTYRGSNDDLVIGRWWLLKRAGWFYITSLTGKSHALLPKIFNFAKKNKIKVAWNPGSVQLDEGYNKLTEFLNSTHILNLNKGEAIELLKSAGSKINFDDEKALLGELKSFGPEIVVITDGPKGAYACDGFMEYYQKALSAEIVDTTGAGDSFGSTFAACQIMGFDMVKSLEFAARNAASVVGRYGATEGLIPKKDLFVLRKEIALK